MSNFGKWEPWYKTLKAGDPPKPYGTTDAYRLGAEWLKDCVTVEDWGCGMGYFRNFVHPDQQYRGIDGTKSPYADAVCDLVRYVGINPDGIFMRGVIEHERRWERLLENAVRSFKRRMCLVLFTPMASDRTTEIAWNDEIKVPDISFRPKDVEAKFRIFQPIRFHHQDIKSDTGYGGERLYYLEKHR